jgi:hypothetical protein
VWDRVSCSVIKTNYHNDHAGHRPLILRLLKGTKPMADNSNEPVCRTKTSSRPRAASGATTKTSGLARSMARALALPAFL